MQIKPAVNRFDGGGDVPGSYWSGVVLLSGGGYTGSGVLTSSGLHILTAAHVLENLCPGCVTVHFPLGEQNTAQAITAYPGAEFTDNNFQHDLGIITLEQSAPPDAERYNLYTDTDEVGQTAAIVGWGQRIDDTLKEGLNTIDTTAMAFYPQGWKGSLDDQLLFDYDDGTPENDTIGNILNEPHLGLGGLEAMITPGDSGGGLFLQDNDELLLAGIHSYIYGSEPWGSPGDIGASTRISSYIDWIMSQTGQEQEIEALTGEPPAKESVPIEVNEGQGVYFLVEIPGGASEYSSVDFLTRDGTAQAGLDYIPTSGQITFEPGDTFARVWVQTLADSLIEGNEDFELVLTNPAGAGFPHDAEELTASRIIVDDVSLTGVTELAEDIFGA